MKLELPIADLQAIRLFSAKKDFRYYLNGVAINKSHLVATNGHFMGALPIYDQDFQDDVLIQDSIELIIPNETIDLFFKGLTAKQKKEGDVLINIDGDNCELVKDGLIIPFRPVDGQFPDYTRIIPKFDEPGFHPSYNWEHMAIFQKAAKLFNSYAHLIQNGNCAAKVTFTEKPEFIGVLMPLRA